MLDLAPLRSAWPDVVLDDATFLAHVERVAGNEPDLDLTTMFLACACLQHEPHALAGFEARYLEPLPRMLSRITSDPSILDEVRQLLRIKLFVGPAPAIERYRRGSFSAWLRVIATRLTIDVLRTRGVAAPTAPLELATEGDAGLALLKLRYRDQVSTAFALAIAALPRTDRAMLRFCFVDNLGLDAIGRVYELSKSAVSRRLARARAILLADVKHRLEVELGVPAPELDSIVKLVRSQLHLSLPRLLKSAVQT